MQSRAFTRTSPHVYRVVRAAPSSLSAPTRSMSLFPAPFFVRTGGFQTNPFASFEREVAPFFRMMEDLNRTFDHHFLVPAANARVAPTPAPAPTPFQPRFDVREVDGAYELRGEVPGVESKDIDVEFTDAQTLVIRGRTASETSAATPSAEQQMQTQAATGVEAAEPTTTNAVAEDAEDAASTHSTSSYQKATVEDEGVADKDAQSAASTPGAATPPESTTSEAQPLQQVKTQAAPAEAGNTADTASPRYWVSERRTGSFQRVFTFPGKVDQEAVTASLKNGVLSVVVPKAVARAPRRISVQ